MRIISKNPTAKHNYFIEDTIETGIVLTGTEYGYRRDDGVLVIPIGCLKD